MSELSKLPDRDERARESKTGEYFVKAVGSGSVVCYRKGMVLVDFYRTGTTLVKDCPRNLADLEAQQQKSMDNQKGGQS